MNRFAKAAVVLLALAAPSAAFAQKPSAALKRYRDDLRECIINNAVHATAQPEATPDTVADYAARRCEAVFIKAVVARRLMSREAAAAEVNVMAYQFANRMLSQ